MKKKVLIIVIVIIVLIGGIGPFLGIRAKNKNAMVDDIKKHMDKTFSNFSAAYNPNLFKGETLEFSIDDLGQMGIDIEEYKDKGCNNDDTKITLKFTDDGYDLDVNLSCKRY